MSKKQSSRRAEPQKLFYTEEFKAKIVQEVLSGKLTKTQAQQFYGIRGNATILYWIRQSQGIKYNEKPPKQIANFADMKQNISDKKLEEELKETKELLRVAELRADVWQKAVEIAEDMFDIDIVKKVWSPSITAIKKQRQKASIEDLCFMFCKTKQAYYKQQKTVEKKALQNEVILGLVQQKREVWKQGSGRNLHKSMEQELKEHDIKIGRDKFFDFLRKNKLLIRPKRFRAKTTNSFHHFNKFDYLIKDKIPTRKNEIWVSDITYIWLKKKGKFCYLSLITDLYSRKIVGYCVHADLTTEGCLVALKMALQQREKKTKKLGLPIKVAFS